MRKALLSLSLLTLPACSSLVGEPMFVGPDEGRFLMSADRAGLQEFGKALNGLVVTGKSAPNKPDTYFQNQSEETQARALRFTARAKSQEVK